MMELEESHQNEKKPFARIYNGLGWGALADDDIFPNIRLSIRGGSNKVTGHGHIDVMSFKCRIGNQTIIEDQRAGGYSPVTFTNRGHHVYSRSQAAKSTLFVHGLAPMEDGETKSYTVITGADILGIRLDGTGLYLPRWRRSFIGRLFLMVDKSYFIVVDASFAGGWQKQLEARFHTYGKLEKYKDWVIIKKGEETLTASFASLDKAKLSYSRGVPENGGRATEMLRWIGKSNFLVSAFNPGKIKLNLEVKKINKGISIHISGNTQQDRVIKVSNGLELMK